MRNAFLVLLLLPLFSWSQSKTYLSADGSANFGKFLEHTGFGLTASGNIKLYEQLYIGLATGLVKVNPFIRNLAVPVSGRITFFTSTREEQIAPFGLFEIGKLIYKEENFGGSPVQTMEGDFSFFTGVGVKLVAKRLHPFFAIGYAGYFYDNNHYTNDNSLAFSKPYNYRRIALRVGLMLPR